MKKTGRWTLIAAGIFLLAGGILWRLIPGVKFTACLCAAGGGGLVLWWGLSYWAKKSRCGRICKGIFLATISAGFVGFCTIECLLVSRGTAENSALPADAVIVLGAGVNGTAPSLILQSRIDAAEAYLQQHPDIPVVLSGGQGPGEEITEARAMYIALTARGVDPTRLILEERSTSTAENFAYSKELLKDSGVDTDGAVIAVVTNGFHCFRAHLIAQRAELSAMEVPAEIPWLFLDVNYYVREAFALVKTVLFD